MNSGLLAPATPRSSRWGPGGRRFESCLPDEKSQDQNLESRRECWRKPRKHWDSGSLVLVCSRLFPVRGAANGPQRRAKGTAGDTLRGFTPDVQALELRVGPRACSLPSTAMHDDVARRFDGIKDPLCPRRRRPERGELLFVGAHYVQQVAEVHKTNWVVAALGVEAVLGLLVLSTLGHPEPSWV